MILQELPLLIPEMCGEEIKETFQGCHLSRLILN